MKALFTTLAIVIISSAMGFAQSHNNPCNKPGKVLVCHIPPGNPENVQEICVSQNAVAAHLAHGCFVGDCERSEETRLMNPDAATETEFVTVYPNPFREQLTIEMVFEDVTQAEVLIYDMKGTLVANPFSGMAESSFILDYNTANLSTGIYVVRIVTPNDVRIFKISKNA